MNSLDNNFLDSSVEEIVEEIEEEVVEEIEEAEADASLINEAIKRIEQAKLYEALLGHDLFQSGSARPEILKKVRREIKEFIQFRLEVLLGIKPDGKMGTQRAAQVVVQNQFSDDQATALRDIANKLIEKNRVVAAVPTITSAVVAQPQIRTLETQTPIPTAPVQQTVVKKIVRKVVRKNGQVVSSEDVSVPEAQPPAEQKPRTPRKKSANQNPFTGQDLSQAVSTARPPVPMPSQAQMDMMNARLASKGMNAAGSVSGPQDPASKNVSGMLDRFLNNG